MNKTGEPGQYMPVVSKGKTMSLSQKFKKLMEFEISEVGFRKGAIVGIVATIPLVELSALVFRFPVPFSGYLSGPGAIFPALISIFIYGVALGGFIIQALLGGIGGFVADSLRHRTNTTSRSFALSSQLSELPWAY
jgi:hypothetical protein